MAAAVATQSQHPSFATPSSPKTSYSPSKHLRAPSSSLTTQPADDHHHHHTTQFRPAKNLEAFNSLLPPAVEFVEGSSTGALAVAEGKYEPINVSPKVKTPGVELNGKSRSSAPSSPTSTKSRSSESQPRKSLFKGKLSFQWPSGYNIGIGFYNQGNTCFLNSALQCLLHTPPLLRLLIEHTKSEPCLVKSSFCMSCSLRKVMADSFSKRSPFSPYPVTRNLHSIAKHLRSGRQEDSHEFLRYAVDSLQKSCLAGYPPKIDHKLAETTWVHKLFGGRLRSRVTCMQCGYNSDTFDSILDLSIDIHGCASLKDALRKFTAVDYLKGADKYKCEKCKRPVNAEKHFTIHDAPPVLTVHLKRFSPLGRKLAHPIRYDERLNLQSSMSEGQFGPTYQLYGVISHAGSGPNSGHYYAHVKSATGQWFEMNDDYVEKVSKSPTGMKNAYILFYMQEKGQSLEAALSTSAGLSQSQSHPRTSSSITNGHKAATDRSVKKQRTDSNDGEGEDTGRKVASSPTKPFIGPQLPPNFQKTTTTSTSTSSSTIQTPPSSPTTPKPYAQAESLRKKIESYETRKENKLTKPPPQPQPPKVPLVDYADDDDDDMDGVSGASSVSATLTIGSQSSVATTTATRSTLKESSPAQPPASSFPSSPLSSSANSTSNSNSPIPASSFYATTSKRATTSTTTTDSGKKRKSPDNDTETSSSDTTRSPRNESRQKKSGSKSAAQDSIRSAASASATSSSTSRSKASNPYGRLKGSDNLNSTREDLIFQPRKLMKKRYGQKKSLM